MNSFQSVKFLLVCTLKCQGSKLICPHMKWRYIKFFVLLNLCLTILCSTVYWWNRHETSVLNVRIYIFVSVASLIRAVAASCNTLPQLGHGVHNTNFLKHLGSVFQLTAHIYSVITINYVAVISHTCYGHQRPSSWRTANHATNRLWPGVSTIRNNK